MYTCLEWKAENYDTYCSDRLMIATKVKNQNEMIMSVPNEIFLERKTAMCTDV